MIERVGVSTRRWVPAGDLAEALSEIEDDQTGWLALNEHHRQNDPLVDPWSDAASEPA